MNSRSIKQVKEHINKGRATDKDKRIFVTWRKVDNVNNNVKRR